MGGRKVAQIMDQDVFYHAIGPSIDSARSADIVVLGPSFSAYALYPGTLRDFEAQTGHTIFNMSFIGVRSGEFTKRVIGRWRLRPKLWIINVDDQFTSFFSRELIMTIGPIAKPIKAVEYNRLHGLLNIIGRNAKWRVEDLIAGSQGDDSWLLKYRSVRSGDMYFDMDPHFIASNNPQIHVDRDQSCHVRDDVVSVGRDYLKEIEGRVVLILVPHSKYCPMQARELAAALGVEVIIPPDVDGITTWDGGGHLDRRGAIRYSTFLFEMLPKTEAYRAISGS